MEVIVVKIGTQAILNEVGSVDIDVLENIARGIHELRRKGKHVILVASGAVGAARNLVSKDSFTNRILDIELAQIRSSIGQPLLMRNFKDVFDEYEIIVAQGLLTRTDFANRERQIAVRNILEKMLGAGVLPIINENDFLTPEELDFSDNDQLASFIAGMLGAEKLIVLTNVDGLFDGDPQNEHTKKVDEVYEIDSQIEGYISKKISRYGLGGMTSKIVAAKLSRKLGITMVLANSREKDVLQKIYTSSTNTGTIFIAPRDSKQSGTRTWLAAGAAEQGSIKLDCSVDKIFKNGSSGTSILGVGVGSVTGTFNSGDVISVMEITGAQVGRGIAKISSGEMRELITNRNVGGKVFIHTNSLYIF